MRKKEQSNNAAPSSRRHTLPKSEILRGRTNFKSLFSNSKFISSPSITLRYTLRSHPVGSIQMAFICPKKLGTAVQRNKIKRLLREAYRLNKELLLPSGGNHPHVQLHGAFIARSSQLSFEAAKKEMVTLLSKLRNHVAAFEPS